MKKLDKQQMDILFWVILALVCVGVGLIMTSLVAQMMAARGTTEVGWVGWFVPVVIAAAAILWKRKRDSKAALVTTTTTPTTKIVP